MQKEELIKALQMTGNPEDPRWQAVQALFTNALAKLEEAKKLDDDKKLEIEQDVDKALRRFLEAYWNISAFTKDDYFHNPYDPFNQCCVAIATSLAKADEAICQILMPNVKLCVTQYEGQSLKDATEEDGKFLPQNYFLSTHDNRLVPIPDVMEYARNDPQYLFDRSNIGKDKYIPAYGKYLLTTADMEFLRTIAGKHSSEYFDALKKLGESEDTLYKAVKNFALAVLASSKAGAGNELEADLTELIGPLKSFYENIWLKLSPEEREKIGNIKIKHINSTVSFRMMLHTLLVRAGLYDYFNEREKQEVFREDIFPCTHQMGETLLEFCSNPDTQKELVSINLNSGKPSEKPVDFKLMQKELNQALEQEHQSPQGESVGAAKLNNLSEVSKIINVILNKKDIQNEFKIENLKKLSAILTITPPKMQGELVSILGDKIKELISTKNLKNNFEDCCEVFDFITSLSEKAQMAFFNLYRNNISVLLPDPNMLVMIVSELSETNQENLIKVALQNQSLINQIDNSHIKRLMDHLPKTVNALLMDALSNKISSFVTNEISLKYLLKRIPVSEQLKLLNILGWEKISELINTEKQFKNLFRNLLKNHPIKLLEILGEDKKIEGFVKQNLINYISDTTNNKKLDLVKYINKKYNIEVNDDNFLKIFSALPTESKKDFLIWLGNEKVKELISDSDTLIKVLRLSSNELQSFILTILDDKIKEMAKDSNVFHFVLKELDLSNYQQFINCFDKNKSEDLAFEAVGGFSDDEEIKLLNVLDDNTNEDKVLFEKYNLDKLFNQMQEASINKYIDILSRYSEDRINEMLTWQAENFNMSLPNIMPESEENQAKFIQITRAFTKKYIDDAKDIDFVKMLERTNEKNWFMLVSLRDCLDINYDVFYRKGAMSQEKIDHLTNLFTKARYYRNGLAEKAKNLDLSEPIPENLAKIIDSYAHTKLFETKSMFSSEQIQSMNEMTKYLRGNKQLNEASCRKYLFKQKIPEGGNKFSDFNFNDVLITLATIPYPTATPENKLKPQL